MASSEAEGRPVITKNSLIPRFGADGAVTGLFVLALDVTDERATEQRLMEAQRMKAVGQLSGGLAHDFNNLLSIILGNLAAARERYAEVEGLDSYLEPAQRASRRGADITSRLLAFSRQHPMKPEPVEVCALVREIAILLRRSLPAGIELVGPRDGAACWAIADQSQLENALVNLALNARDAMPGGGRLTMAVAVRKVSEPLAFDETVAPDDYLEIRVADSGCGFAPEALSRAFEPFFSTKAQGSGLGLSMVYGFVKQSRGYIRLDSAPGEGTTVTILLPRAEPAPLEVEAPAPVVGDAPPADGAGLFGERGPKRRRGGRTGRADRGPRSGGFRHRHAGARRHRAGPEATGGATGYSRHSGQRVLRGCWRRPLGSGHIAKAMGQAGSDRGDRLVTLRQRGSAGWSARSAFT